MKHFVASKTLVFVVIGASLLLVSTALVWGFVSLRGTSQPIVLHWDPFYGIDRVGGIRELLIMGVSGILTLAVNFAIIYELLRRDYFWARLAASLTLLVSVLLFLAFAAIIHVN